MNILPRLFIFAASVFLLSAVSLSAGEASGEEKALVEKLLGAIQNKSYETFVADGTPYFKQIIKKPQFDAMSDNLGPLLKEGYEIAYLDDSEQRGFHVTRWQLKLIGSANSISATLSQKEGKVGGFQIR